MSPGTRRTDRVCIADRCQQQRLLLVKFRSNEDGVEFVFFRRWPRGMITPTEMTPRGKAAFKRDLPTSDLVVDILIS